jgi:hypothetical protein
MELSGQLHVPAALIGLCNARNVARRDISRSEVFLISTAFDNNKKKNKLRGL